ncbi:hypothetical protein ACFQVA_09860 [Actinomadura keratinilytica]
MPTSAPSPVRSADRRISPVFLAITAVTAVAGWGCGRMSRRWGSPSSSS